MEALTGVLLAAGRAAHPPCPYWFARVCVSLADLHRTHYINIRKPSDWRLRQAPGTGTLSMYVSATDDDASAALLPFVPTALHLVGSVVPSTRATRSDLSSGATVSYRHTLERIDAARLRLLSVRINGQARCRSAVDDADGAITVLAPFLATCQSLRTLRVQHATPPLVAGGCRGFGSAEPPVRPCVRAPGILRTAGGGVLFRHRAHERTDHGRSPPIHG